jgi:hypothetical protein
LRKADEVAPQQRAVFARGQRFSRRFHHGGTESTEEISVGSL